MRTGREIYKVGKQGEVRFNLRTRLAKDRVRAEQLLLKSVVSLVLMVVCMVIDFFNLSQLFSAFLYDAIVMQRLLTITALIGIDCSVIYLGIVLKKKEQGFKVGRYTAGTLLSAFIVTFAANMTLRIATKDLVLPDWSVTSTSVFGEVQKSGTDNDLALIYALFAGVMPLITSLVSFAVSYLCYDPLREKVGKLEREQVAIEDEIGELESIMMEYESDEGYLERLKADDDKKYQNMKEIIQEQGMYYCSYVRERLKEHLGNPTSSNELSKDNRRELLNMLEGSAKTKMDEAS